jgi:hypothetical protein
VSITDEIQNENFTPVAKVTVSVNNQRKSVKGRSFVTILTVLEVNTAADGIQYSSWVIGKTIKYRREKLLQEC